MSPFRFFLCALFLAGACWGAEAKVSLDPRLKQPDQQRARSPDTRINVDVSLVLVNVTVTDPLSRPVTGLQKEHFRIKEDKVEQEIRHFGAEDAPVSVGIIFDTSGSIGDKMAKCREAVAQFVKTANPQDEFFLVQFNDRAELVVPLTRRPEDILRACHEISIPTAPY